MLLVSLDMVLQVCIILHERRDMLHILLSIAILNDIATPEIRVIDRRAKLFIGTDTIVITCHDILKYTGKVCPGVSTGIRVAMLGLKGVYGDSIPDRGDILVAVPYEGEITDVISYITGVRMGHGLVVDGSLSRDTLVSYIFGSRSRKRCVSVSFNESRIHGQHERFTLERFKTFIEDMLNGRSDSVFSIKRVDYRFPEMEDEGED